MMRWKPGAALVAFCLVATSAMPAMAQNDPRLRLVRFVEDQLVPLPVASGYQTLVSFARDEQIETIAVGDNTGWKVDANRRGDFLFVKLSAGAQQTNMTVVTTQRVYHLMLIPVFDNLDQAVFAMRFTYDIIGTTASNQARQRYSFTLGGARNVRPMAITEDGQRTYLRWPAKVPLPAVYRIDDGLAETLANGIIEGDAMVLEGVPIKIVFRLGRSTATAQRKLLRVSR